MTDLLDAALFAHGGRAQWNSARSLTAMARVDGELWGRRGQAGALAHTRIEADLHVQRLVFHDFKGRGRTGIFTPRHVSIEEADGLVSAERADPVKVLAGQSKTSTWDDLSLSYNAGFDLWAFLLGAFVLTMPGVTIEETAPLEEAGERWRRLTARFPADLVMHAREQSYAFNTAGQLRRLDYAPASSGVPGNVNYIAEYRPFAGLSIATRRRMLPTDDSGRASPSPILMSVDVESAVVG